MRHRRFQFGLPGLLGLMTCVAMMLAAVQYELGVVALAGVYVALIVFMSTLFFLALLRGFWTATRRRSWESFRVFSTKGGVIALGLLLSISIGGLYWSFGGGLEEIVGDQWVGKCRAGASAVGVGAALLNARHRSFWVANDAVEREGNAENKQDIVVDADGDE